MFKSLPLLLLCAITFVFCAKPAPKAVERVKTSSAIAKKAKQNTVFTDALPLANRLAQYPFSESAKIELVALVMSEFADMEEKKARDSTGCTCKSVFSYPLKDSITQKTLLSVAQIDTLTAILFKKDSVVIGKSKGLVRIENALFFYDKNEKLFARLYIDTQLSGNWTLYKNKKEIVVAGKAYASWGHNSPT